MQPSEIYRLLGCRPRRGRIVFGTLFLACSVSGGFALAIDRVAWVVAAFFAGLLVGLGFRHVRERDVSARSVAECPELVYWAHPATIPVQDGWLFACTHLRFLMLHLRDGRQFEAGLPPDEMSLFISWLTEQNPTIRMGTYDNTKCA